MKKLPMSISGAFSYQIDAMENHCRKREAPRPLCIRTGCLYMMLENVSNLNRVGAMN